MSFDERLLEVDGTPLYKLADTRANERRPAIELSEACPDCGLPSWLPALNVTFDETKHCLARHLSTKPGCWPDVLACKDRTIARQREQLAVAKHLLQRQHDLLDEAAVEMGVDLG